MKRKLSTLLAGCCLLTAVAVNPTPAKASTDIVFGQTYTDTFYDALDHSVTLSTPEDGYIVFTMDKPVYPSGKAEGLFVELFDTENNYVWAAATPNSVEDDPTVTAYSFTLGVPAGSYTFVYSSNDVEKNHPTVNYRFDFTADSHYETEYNDTFATADAMDLDTMYGGVYGEENTNSKYTGDADCFSVNLKKGDYYRIYVENYDSLFEGTCQIVVTNPDNKATNIKRKLTGDTSTKSFDFVAAKDGTYYIKLSNQAGLYGVPYKLGVYNITPKAPTLKSVTAGKKAFTAKYEKVDKVLGYEVCYSTNKSFKSSKSVIINKQSVTSKKVSGLKANTKYYVRVRSFIKLGNKKGYSSWSKVKTVKTK